MIKQNLFMRLLLLFTIISFAFCSIDDCEDDPSFRDSTGYCECYEYDGECLWWSIGKALKELTEEEELALD
jgi:hypothetical protein